MKASSEYLKILIDKCGEDWKNKLDTYLKNDESDSDDKIYFDEFIKAYKEDIIDSRIENIRKTEKIINNDLLLNSIKNFVDDILGAYYAIEPLRILETKDYEMSLRAVDCIFVQVICRFNPDIADQYGEYSFLSKEDFLNTIGVLSSLSEFAVTHNLYIDAIYDAIYQNTRLSHKMCRHIANRINEDFDQLRLKLIIDKLYQES